ncbi:MAG TPA: peptidylprolyl isomerase [Pseudolysinimonas sp.]|jgi:peptidyl-prolyl cis-trans isomerase A (cyclophilin A)
MPLHTAVATIHTNHGDIRVNLFGNHAPITVDNFVGLATGAKEWTDPATGEKKNTPLYDGVIFHRIIKDFMLQGGDPLGQGIGGPGYNFDDEIHPELNFAEPYVLAMANAGTQAGHGTNGSQFFITTVPTPWLQAKHTIFGEVADDASKKVVDEIEAVPTGRGDAPVDPVVISGIDVTEA